MQLAILSDIHDNVWKLRSALEWIADPDNGIDALIICGDLCSPFVLAMIQQAFAGPVHLVFGNNDGDTWRMTSLAAEQVHLHGELAELVFAEGELRAGWTTRNQGLRIGVNHFPNLADSMIRSGRYDVVCYGHNHRLRISWHDRATGQVQEQRSPDAILAINPGALMGFIPAPEKEGEHDIPATYVVLNLSNLQAGVRTV